jgi:outer membrane protein OmpA-like peptidoglycan-associated protein
MNLSGNKWSTPLNLGYPINTSDDNLFYYPVNSGEYTYFSDAKLDESGGTEIYMMKLQIPENPNEFEISGNVAFSDKKSHSDIVKISLLDSLNITDTIAIFYTNLETGNYSSVVPAGNYQISFEAKSYKKEILDLYIPRILSRQQFVLDVTLVPEQLLSQKELVVENTANNKEKEGYIAIKNVHFDEKKQDLDFDSQVELERMYKILEVNPSLSIFVSGKSKSEFGEAYDEKLTLKRQENIVNYLTAKGIDRSRFELEENKTGTLVDNSGNVEIKLFKAAKDSVKLDEEIFMPNNIRFKDDLIYTVILKGTNEKLDEKSLNSEITDVLTHQTQNGFVYTSGKFSKLFEAVKYMNKCIDLGFTEASIVDNFELQNIKNSSYLASSDAKPKTVETEKTVEKSETKPVETTTSSTKSSINFTIQLGVFSASIGVDNFKNVGTVIEHIGVDNKYRYLYGTFDSYSKAKEKLSEIIKLGYSEAFIMNTERYKK